MGESCMGESWIGECSTVVLDLAARPPWIRSHIGAQAPISTDPHGHVLPTNQHIQQIQHARPCALSVEYTTTQRVTVTQRVTQWHRM